jgi:hypothetical protein
MAISNEELERRLKGVGDLLNKWGEGKLPHLRAIYERLFDEYVARNIEK